MIFKSYYLLIIYPTIIIFHGSIKDAELNDWNKMESNTAIEADTFNKKNIVLAKIKHILGLDSTKIMARKCTVKEITYDENQTSVKTIRLLLQKILQ